MITLLQLINRMIYLEYSQSEVECIFDDLAEGNITAHDLYDSLNLELQSDAMLSRFFAALPRRHSAIALSFLAKEESA
jgi:hypothetical protein